MLSMSYETPITIALKCYQATDARSIYKTKQNGIWNILKKWNIFTSRFLKKPYLESKSRYEPFSDTRS